MSGATLDLVAPAFHWCPPSVASDGGVVAGLCELGGLVPDGEQRLILDDIFALDAADRVAAFEVGIICARQNLKTAVLQMATLGWLLDENIRLIVWSAHEYRTAQEAFRDVDNLIHANPHLAARVRRVYRANGDEQIEMRSGARLLFKARTKGAGRGLTGDRVVLDEAFALRPMHVGALLPTLSARPDPQVIYASSAGLADSDVLRSIRDRGRAGGDPSLAYLEWGDATPVACGTADCDHRITAVDCALDDRERWRAANPAMGRRIAESYIAAERRALPPEEFARERLGWWDDPLATQEGIGEETWAALFDAAAAPTDPVWFGLDVAPNHAAASIVAAGGGAIELVDRRPGSNWLVDRCTELLTHGPAGFAYDPSGPVGVLVGELESAGLTLTAVEGQESVRACGAFTKAILERSFRHRGEPEFASAVAGARRRQVGDGHKWSRKDSTVDISPLVAATVALWASTEHGHIGEPGLYLI